MHDCEVKATVDVPIQRRSAIMARIAPFQTPSLRHSLWQFGSTLLGYVAVNAIMYAVLGISIWLVLALAVLAAGFVVRLFIVQHDCGHGSFFRSRRLNDGLGRFCSVFTFTPYAFWRRQHANHHASFNNLDRRDTGIDIYSTCATLREYLAMPRGRRWAYRLLRHPLMAQCLLPPLVFVVLYRLPFDTPAGWRQERASVHLTNLALLSAFGVLAVFFGIEAVAVVQLPIIAMAAIAGVWLFSVQHRFEEAHWARQEDWNVVQASVEGSSYLKLPRVLQWFTGSIGFHHVHHLSARVPNYRLQDCHRAIPELSTVTTLTLSDALRAPLFALWDEDNGRMTRFPS